MVEELLKQAVEKIDPSKVSSNLSENIKFLQNRGMIPESLVEPLDKIRTARNSFIHPTPKTPNASHLRDLKAVKDEVETIFKK
ncbi:DUF4145 domain-containing protein [Allocoleopsis franciscana]|uniref:DUF4145 domain-containing protein n=1 Tax=Allocoleopsis franciscana TaxID=2886352 RepID=UPI0009DAD9F1